MNNLVQQFDFSFLAASWLPQVVLVIVAIIVLNIGAYFLLRKIEKIALLSPSVWDDALIKATRKPLTLILWVTGATFAIQIVHSHLGTPVYDFVTPTRNTLVIIALAWFLLRLIGQASRNMLAPCEATEDAIDRTTVDALTKLGRVTVIIVDR